MPPAFLSRGTRSVLVLVIGAPFVVALIGTGLWALSASGAAGSDEPSFAALAYGAGLAFLAVLVLVGTIATLTLQGRATVIAREEARRSAIGELLKMAMDDPDLDEAWGPVPDGEDRTARRQLIYINMIIAEWQMSYETRALGEARLRAISHEMFRGRPGRTFWEQAGEIRLTTSEGGRAYRFHQILDEEYKRALALLSEQPESRQAI